MASKVATAKRASLVLHQELFCRECAFPSELEKKHDVDASIQAYIQGLTHQTDTKTTTTVLADNLLAFVERFEWQLPRHRLV